MNIMFTDISGSMLKKLYEYKVIFPFISNENSFMVEQKFLK